MITPEAVSRFIEEQGAAVLVTIGQAKGSVPREAGAWMLVGKDRLLNTIGGGQLEFAATHHARAILTGEQTNMRLDVPLGPAIGQCCGGHVSLEFRRLTDSKDSEVHQRVAAGLEARPHVYLFGAGHVGRALAHALSLLPLRTIIVETRAETLVDLPSGVEPRLTPLPEQVVASAPAGSAFVVFTHEHALDFLVTKAALERDDAAYVGMIGSDTKRATFESAFRREGGDPRRLQALTCPIGAKLSDKRPEIIAALVAAELVAVLVSRK